MVRHGFRYLHPIPRPDNTCLTPSHRYTERTYCLRGALDFWDCHISSSQTSKCLEVMVNSAANVFFRCRSFAQVKRENRFIPEVQISPHVAISGPNSGDNDVLKFVERPLKLVIMILTNNCWEQFGEVGFSITWDRRFLIYLRTPYRKVDASGAGHQASCLAIILTPLLLKFKRWIIRPPRTYQNWLVIWLSFYLYTPRFCGRGFDCHRAPTDGNIFTENHSRSMYKYQKILPCWQHVFFPHCSSWATARRSPRTIE